MKKPEAITKIEAMLTKEFIAGKMPWCMDDEDDRHSMAVWIYQHFRV